MDSRLAVHLRLAELDDERYVEWLYRVALRREPDEEGRHDALVRLRERRVSRASLLAELVGGDDFVTTRALDDAVAAAARARRTGERLRALTAPAAADAHAIELPWVLSRYHEEEHVLDLGYTVAEPAYLLGLLELRADRLVGVDVTGPIDVPGIETVRADIRSLPFRNETFDLAFCVSALDHAGKEAALPGLGRGRVERGLRELRRVLTERGRVLISVSTGAEEEHGWSVQHAPDRWCELFGHAGFAVAEHEVYATSPADGWRAVEAPPPGEPAILCAELHVDRDAARSLRERVRGLTHRV
jgi:SAM-dependent methyltransferase